MTTAQEARAVAAWLQAADAGNATTEAVALLTEYAALLEQAQPIDAAIAAEREACAKLCESREAAWLSEADRHHATGDKRHRDMITRQAYGNGECAAAIRARKP